MRLSGVCKGRSCSGKARQGGKNRIGHPMATFLKPNEVKSIGGDCARNARYALLPMQFAHILLHYAANVKCRNPQAHRSDCFGSPAHASRAGIYAVDQTRKGKDAGYGGSFHVVYFTRVTSPVPLPSA